MTLQKTIDRTETAATALRRHLYFHTFRCVEDFVVAVKNLFETPPQSLTGFRWKSIGRIGLDVDILNTRDPATQDGPHLSYAGSSPS